MVEETPQNSVPIRGRGASWSPANRFEKLYVDLTDADVVDIGPETEQTPRPPTQYFRDGTKSIITRNTSPDVGFETSLNPYRGCEHGCIYCYARPTHEYLGFSAGLDFESKIMVKTNAPELLRAELESARWQPQTLVLSGVTDPYQPIEKKLQITRGCLEVLAQFRNPVAIITKNHLVTRDIDVLRELAADSAVAVNVSVTSLDPTLQRLLEPRTTSPQGRLDAIGQLRSGEYSSWRNGCPHNSRAYRPRSSEYPGGMREGRRAVCRLHDCSSAMGGGAVVRTVAGGTFSGSQREGARAHPSHAKKSVESFAVAHAHDRGRNFRRANRITIQSRLPSRRHWEAADALLQIISPIGNPIKPLWLSAPRRKGLKIGLPP